MAPGLKLPGRPSDPPTVSREKARKTHTGKHMRKALATVISEQACETPWPRVKGGGFGQREAASLNILTFKSQKSP